MKHLALCLGLLCAVLFAVPAWAEDNAADRTTARALALEGQAALEKKDYSMAADRFGRADALVHAPTLVVDWARALRGLGRLVEAHEKYELVLREGVDGSSPKSWLRALDDAKKELDALKPQLAWVTIILWGPAEATVKIDGVVLPPAALGVKRAANPGVLEIAANATGHEPSTQSVALGPGDEKSIEVTLKKLPEVRAPWANSTDPFRPRQKGDVRRVLTYAAFGVGGAGLVAGGITGALALRDRSKLKAECQQEACRASSQDRIDSYHTYGSVSGVTLAVGVAGIGAGIVLLATQPKREARASAPPRLQPIVGLGVLGVKGAF